MKQIFLICPNCRKTETFYFKFPYRPEIIESLHLFCVYCAAVIQTSDTMVEPRFYKYEKKENNKNAKSNEN